MTSFDYSSLTPPHCTLPAQYALLPCGYNCGSETLLCKCHPTHITNYGHLLSICVILWILVFICHITWEHCSLPRQVPTLQNRNSEISVTEKFIKSMLEKYTRISHIDCYGLSGMKFSQQGSRR